MQHGSKEFDSASSTRPCLRRNEDLVRAVNSMHILSRPWALCAAVQHSIGEIIIVESSGALWDAGVCVLAVSSPTDGGRTPEYLVKNSIYEVKMAMLLYWCCGIILASRLGS